MADGAEERSQNETVYAAALDRVCATFGVQALHEEQRKAIDTFFEGKDVFVSLPTGYGKSVIFQAIPVFPRGVGTATRRLDRVFLKHRDAKRPVIVALLKVSLAECERKSFDPFLSE